MLRHDRKLHIQISFGRRSLGLHLSGTPGQGPVVWSCLQLLEGLGYSIQDPQLARRLDLTRDYRAVFRDEALPAPENRVVRENDWPSGTGVVHAKFGFGAVVSAEGAGASAKLTILFADGETKRLVASAVQRA